MGFWQPTSRFFVLATLAIALTAAATIIAARRLADGQRQAVTHLEEINEQAYRLNGIEWKIVATGEIEITDREGLQEAREITESNLKKLEREVGQA
jgi:hypothetical protein